MRYRLMATYLGVPYHAGLGPDGTEVTLFSPGPPPEELGFTAAAGHWRKQVSITDLEALWQSRLVGEYRGEPCLVLDDPGGRLHLAYLGRDTVRARQLGYWEIDREVFEVVVPPEEVDGLTEERVEFPLSAAMFPSSQEVPPAGGTPRPGGDPLSGVLPSASVFGSASSEPEPDTLIHARLRPQGYVPRADAEPGGPPTGPRTRMEPTGRGQPPAQPPRAEPLRAPRPTRPQPVIPTLRVQPPPGAPSSASPSSASPSSTGPRPALPPYPVPPYPVPPYPVPPSGAGQPAAEPGRTPPGAEPAGRAETDRGPGSSNQMAAWHGSPAPEPWSGPWPARESRAEPWPEPWDDSEAPADGRGQANAGGSQAGGSQAGGSQAGGSQAGGLEDEVLPQLDQGPHGDDAPQAEPAVSPPTGRRTARKDRVSPQAVFAELLNLAGIPHAAYAVGEEVPGAMCVVKADGGFEVFSCTEDARLEVHFFEEEEAAYFYLFGVLAAEAVRSGRLGPTRPNGYVNGSRGEAAATPQETARENVSKYLRSRKLPKSPSHPDIVN